MFVSLSQNRSVGAAPSGPSPATSSSSPNSGWSISIVDAVARSRELRASRPSSSHDQVLRNQAVGSTWSVSVSGPALVTRTVMSRSVGVGLGVVDLDDPVPVVVERAGVEQLVLGLVLAPTAVLRDQVVVGERPLRIVVAPPVERVARQRVDVPPVLLGVLAVVALVAGQAEDPLLEDRVAAVPEREREAEPLLDVGEAGQAVLAPAVGPRAGVVVREVVPRLAVGAVVLADRAPLPLAQVRAPQVPVAGLQQAVLELAERLDPLALLAHRSDHGTVVTRRPRTVTIREG